MTVTIAIDGMGGDFGPSVTLPAAVSFLQRNDHAEVIIVGRPEVFDLDRLSLEPGVRRRLHFQTAAEVVLMDEGPANALRNKKDSSMRIAIDLVKQERAQAIVSAGNTGALMAISRFVLRTLPGIDRPAIVTILPARNGRTYVLDLGANVDCSAEHLLQFGVMGSALVSAVEHIEAPSVGLLNIGEEAIKGNEIVKQAADLLRDSHLNFIGNVEGNDIYTGSVDVVVCDGFVGNVLLKTSEGLAQMLADALREEFNRGILSRLAALMAMPVLKRFKHRMDPRRYNGAALVGLKGVVVKSHGSADAFAFEQALHRAAEAAQNGLVGRIEQHFLNFSHEVAAQEVVS